MILSSARANTHKHKRGMVNVYFYLTNKPKDVPLFEEMCTLVLHRSLVVAKIPSYQISSGKDTSVQRGTEASN